MTPALQFVVFLLITIVVIFLSTAIAVLVIGLVYGFATAMDVLQLKLDQPYILNALYILQIIGTTIPILIAPVFYAYVVVKQPAEYLRLQFKSSWLLFMVAFFIMLIASPLIELSSNINQKMVLPEFLRGLEEWMKQSEAAARKVTEFLLKMDSVGALIRNVLLVGLLTAIVEELMFRGVLQTIMLKWTKNAHAAVWITAMLFSAFHMEFYGFLPRTILGALFGYFVIWSGSIWPAVWGHFLNNGTAVVVTYLFQHKK